jgi:hypothetical protein
VVFLCTTRACPAEDVCIVLSSNFPFAQYEPGLLDWDLLPCKTGSLAFTRIMKCSYKPVSVSRECLGDQSIGSKVHSWVIMEVKYQMLEISPHCLNYHGSSLLWIA